MKDTPSEPPFLAHHPLIPAAVVFLAGVAAGRLFPACGALLLALATAFWLAWILAEWKHARRCAHAALAMLILFSGMTVWILNQHHVAATHVIRWTLPDTESIAIVRATVLVSPVELANGRESQGNRAWLARVTQIRTDQGWLPATGDMLVQSPPSPNLAHGTAVELYGWLARPRGALNPGAFDPRAKLAADRLFVQMRVPRASGVAVIDASAAAGESPLARLRLYLRAKLLSHLIQEDVPAAQTLTALLLGYRDPAIADVSQSFADAGVAHLLAISGSHIVFFTGLVWALLRFLPLRPRWREILIAAIVGIYVLATPCGPPIVRAGIALLMVLLARLMGRPRQYLNMLAAAAVVVVLLRPTDLFDAGFQLSFVTTAGLLLLSSRVHAALFGPWLMRLSLIAELARTRWSRWRLRIARGIAAMLTANFIGALTAAPLVAFHFGQVNFWAVLAGLVALPIVSAAMVVAALQLLLELAGAGALFSLPTAFVGRAMIWLVDLLARLPGSALPVRAPPAWLILAMYVALLLWILRRRIGLSRALVVNAALGIALLTTGWYAWSAPVGKAQLTVLSTGNGTCLLLRTPRGDFWNIDAGSDMGASVVSQALVPALRRDGSRRIAGQLVTALDARHARQAADVFDTCRPRQILLSQPWWEARQQTLAGWQLAQAAGRTGTPVAGLHAGDAVDLGGCRMHVLWPPKAGEQLGRRDLILLCEIQGKRLLIADPASAGPLALLPAVRCEGVLFTGAQRGAGDAAARRAIAGCGATVIVWNGRGPWAPARLAAGEWNTDDGAVVLDFSRPAIHVARAVP